MTQSRKKLIKYMAYALILLIVHTMENARGLSVTLWGATVNAVPFLIASVALFDGPYAGGVLGFMAGLVAAIGSPMVEGVAAMYLGLFGVSFGYLGGEYMRAVLPSAMLGGAVCIALNGVIRYVFYYWLVFSVNLGFGLRAILAELALSALPGAVMFFAVRFIGQKLSRGEGQP